MIQSLDSACIVVENSYRLNILCMLFVFLGYVCFYLECGWFRANGNQNRGSMIMNQSTHTSGVARMLYAMYYTYLLYMQNSM